VEEYGRDWYIRGCHVYYEIWEQLHYMMARVLANFGPNNQDYTARMAHVSHKMRYGWLLPLLDLLQQSPRMIFRTTTNLLDQEDCYGVSL